MAYQEQQQQQEGWPLGLRPVNARIGVIRRSHHHEVCGSVSFSTLLTSSPSSSAASSSDLDSKSTWSFFHEKSITLGSLIGISSILELSRRSTRRRIETSRDNQKNNILKSCKPCLFSLCSKLTTDAVSQPTTTTGNNTQSLAHFLRAERRPTGPGAR